MDAVTNVPPPVNEPVRQYPPGSADRTALEHKIKELAADPDAPRRRVVLAADIPDGLIGHNGGFDEPTAVEISAPVAVDRVVSGHVDEARAMPDIAEAVAALPAADRGDDDARFVVDGAEGHELLWYASQELAYLTG